MAVSPQNPETEVEAPSIRCITTLYALISTLQAHGDPGDDASLRPLTTWVRPVASASWVLTEDGNKTS